MHIRSFQSQPPSLSFTVTVQYTHQYIHTCSCSLTFTRWFYFVKIVSNSIPIVCCILLPWQQISMFTTNCACIGKLLANPIPYLLDVLFIYNQLMLKFDPVLLFVFSPEVYWRWAKINNELTFGHRRPTPSFLHWHKTEFILT